MRIPCLCRATGVILATLATGCGLWEEPSPPAAPPVSFVTSDLDGPRKVSHVTVLDFQIIDSVSRAPIETGSLQIRYAYAYAQPIGAVKNGKGIWRLTFQTWYFPQPDLPSESYFLGGQWLEVDAPGYDRVKVPLREFVGERRADDEASSEKSAPLVVSLRKGECKPKRLEFIAGHYSADEGVSFILHIDADGTFGVYIQDQHGRVPVGFGFAEIVDGRLTLTYAESNSHLASSPRMTELLAMVHAVIKQ